MAEELPVLNAGYNPPPVVANLWTPGDARPGTTGPEAMRDRLIGALVKRNKETGIFDRYYRGDHNLAFAGERFRSAFGRLFSSFADNWCPIVVDAVEERLNVEGFRFGDTPEGDDVAWRYWQTNDLDAFSQIAHTEALIHRVSYTMAVPGATPDDVPEITIEHPTQAIVQFSASRRRERLAGLKLWADDSGLGYATLYTPAAVYKWQTLRPLAKYGAESITWVPRLVDGEEWPMRNIIGVVPLIPLRNRPRLLDEGESELAGVIPLQDAVNKLVADLLVASEFAAFRQRYVSGMELPTDEATGAVIQPFKPAVDRLWMTEDDAKFGEFSESDLSNFVSAIEMLIQHVASETRTPPHYFYLRGQFPSGESIKSAETGLVAKAKRKMRHFGEAWEETLRLAFSIVDDPRAAFVGAETIWSDPEYRTEGEHVDALVKLKALGVPDEQLQEDAGYTSTQRRRFAAMRAHDALVGNVLGAPALPEPV